MNYKLINAIYDGKENGMYDAEGYLSSAFIEYLNKNINKIWKNSVKDSKSIKIAQVGPKVESYIEVYSVDSYGVEHFLAGTHVNGKQSTYDFPNSVEITESVLSLTKDF